MLILRRRIGFQADHSSSSYLFYAAERPVSAVGQKIAHRYSSRAEVSDRFARYQKWGDSELSDIAYKALLSKHYDVMVSESYDWWAFMIAVPKIPALKAALAKFRDARGGDDLGVDIENYGSRIGISIYCRLSVDGPAFDFSEDGVFEPLVRRLTKIRQEIIKGNLSFLEAVASFYHADIDQETDPAKSRGARRKKKARLSQAARSIIENLEQV